MPGAGAGKRRTPVGAALSTSSGAVRGGATSDPLTSATQSLVSTNSPSAAVSAMTTTTSVTAPTAAPTVAPAAVPASAALPIVSLTMPSASGAGSGASPLLTPSSHSPSHSAHSSHSPVAHRSSTRHRLIQALGLLQRQQRLLQSVLRTTPEGPPPSRGGQDRHHREKWSSPSPKAVSKSPSAKRKTSSTSATDVRRKRSRKNKKRKTAQVVEV